VGNIYEKYDKIVAEQEAEGLVPVIYLYLVNKVQVNRILRIPNVKGPAPKDLKFVVCDNLRLNYVDVSSYILFAKDEKTALEVFRKRALYERRLARVMDLSRVPQIYGIDVHGEIRSSAYLPMLNLLDISEEKFEEAVNYANLHMANMNIGGVCGELRGDCVGHLYFKLREELVGSQELDTIRSKTLNSLYNYFDEQLYKVERLDDRGGTNVENICKYLTPYGRKTFLKKIDCESKLKINTNNNNMEEKYENLSQVR